jgi:hypothetical protein
MASQPGTLRALRALALSAALPWILTACGANDAEPTRPGRSGEAAPAQPAPADEPEAPVAEEPEPEEPAAAAPPEPDPIVIEAGVQLGPIRLGMSEGEVRALGLEERPEDPRSRRFGPYRVFFDSEGVRRVEASMGQLGRLSIGGEVLPSGTHISRIRDAFGACEWHEGGGERYRCAGGSLFVQTAHSMDPALYTVGVERR